MTDDLATVIASAGQAAFEIAVDASAIARVIDAARAAGITDAVLRDHAAEVCLGAGCATKLPAALAALDRVYVTRVRDVVAPKRLPAHAVDEIRQTVRERLLGGDPPYIAGAVGRGSLASLVAVIATRAALDWLRAQARTAARVDPEPVGDELAATGNPARDHLRSRYRGELKAAFEGAVAELEPRERTILRMHLVEGLIIDDIAQLYQIHRATAARQIERARERVAAATRKALARTTGVTGDELGELAALVTSQIDLSLSRVLR